MKRQTLCLVTLGSFLGLAVGCTKHNPAFHKPADGGVSPSQDVAAADTPVNVDHPSTDTPVTPKDAENRPETRRETGADGPRLVDGQDEVGPGLPDALGLDGRADSGADTQPTKDTALDTFVPDGAIGPSFDVPPTKPEVELPDVPVLPQDAADAPVESDGPEGPEAGEVVPDADVPDAWPDAEPDVEPLTDV